MLVSVVVTMIVSVVVTFLLVLMSLLDLTAYRVTELLDTRLESLL